jgi:nitrate reductase delta subunit
VRIEAMTTMFKSFAALLSYPTEPLRAALPEIGAIIAQSGLPSVHKDALGALIDVLAGDDLIDAQERYVAVFDSGRQTSLNLFEHVHGESRDRGQAMVDLARVYEEAGFRLCANELPDYLPALLEFASLQPPDVGREMLRDAAHILQRIGDALRRRQSPYAAVLDAVLVSIGSPALARDAEAAPPEKTLDEEWVEEPVIFGAAGRCAVQAPPRPAVVQFVPTRGNLEPSR